jgi:integral membrane sensor domain MASE1
MLAAVSDAGARTTAPGKTPSRQLLEIIAVGVVYYTAARLGLLLQLPGTNASPVWPPSGIGLAAMLLFGTRVWPGIAAAAFFANLLTLPFTSAGLLAAAAIAAGNTVEQLVAVSLIRRVSPALNPFECARDALWFVAAALASCLIAATNGATVLRLSGIIGPQLYRSAWLTWWVGDFAGMVILGPALYACGRRPRIDWSSARMLEAAGLAVTAVLVGELVLGNWTTVPFVASQKYLLIPPILWAAFRFGQREASSLAVVVSTIAFVQMKSCSESSQSFGVVVRSTNGPSATSGKVVRTLLGSRITLHV